MTTIIHTPTSKMEDSLNFYSRLGFSILPSQNATLVTDGSALIEINPDRFARAGMKLIAESWEKTTKELRKLTAVLETNTGFLLSDPSGVWIYLEESASGIKRDLSGIPPAILGNFAGLSLESIPIQQSLQIWELLGFSKQSGSIEQGWISLKNKDGMGISLMKPMACPHLFFNPSLTYFNGGNNLEVIAKIRKADLLITEEITYFNKEGVVDNVILRDPGGYGFFVFND